MSAFCPSPVWDDLLRSLRGSVNRETFETWFLPIKFEELDSSARTIRLRAPNHLTRDWVVSNYSGVIDRSLQDVHLAGYSLSWSVDDSESQASRDLSSNVTVTESRSPASESGNVALTVTPDPKSLPSDPSLNSK